MADGIGCFMVLGAVGCIAAVIFSWWVSLWIAIPLTAAACVPAVAFLIHLIRGEDG